MKKLVIALLIGSFLAPLCFAGYASAESTSKYSVHPVLPGNQKEDITDYFYLQQPLQEQTLEIEVKNLSEEELMLNLLPVTGITSDHGEIKYTNQTDVLNGKLLTNDNYLFDNYIRINTEKITIAPKSKTKASVTIYPPNEPLGTILGGVLFYPDMDMRQEKSNENDSEKEPAKRMADMQVVAIAMDTGEVTPEEKSIEVSNPWFQYAQNIGVIRLPVANLTPKIVEIPRLTYRIYTDDQLLFEDVKENLQFAPVSKAQLILPWDQNPIEKGKYLLEGEIETGEETIPFSFKLKVKLTNTNEAPITIASINSWWIWTLMALGLVIIITFAVWLHKRRGESKKAYEQGSLPF